MLNWLLIFVPVAIGLEYFRPEAHTYITSIMRQIEGEAYETCTIFKHMAL